MITYHEFKNRTSETILTFFLSLKSVEQEQLFITFCHFLSIVVNSDLISCCCVNKERKGTVTWLKHTYDKKKEPKKKVRQIDRQT
jgi:hypothetical protein